MGTNKENVWKHDGNIGQSWKGKGPPFPGRPLTVVFHLQTDCSAQLDLTNFKRPSFSLV